MYYKAKELALSNNHKFHVVAILYRGKGIITIEVNSNKTHPKSYRTYSRGKPAATLHAEASALRKAKPGDRLVVMRFCKDGTLTMSKPCEHCDKLIRQHNLNSVTYSDYDANFQTLDL